MFYVLTFFSVATVCIKRFALCYRTVVLSVLSCVSVTLVYCGQTVRWIKMPLGMEIGHSYSERLQKLNLQSLELRRIHYDLTLTYEIVFGLSVLKHS